MRRRFVRAVHLERDFDDVEALHDYVVTEATLDAFARIIDGLRVGSRQRAWRLTGVYGSGKSSFALALAQILSRPPKQVPVRLRQFSKKCAAYCGDGGFLPLLLTASRNSLARLLLERVIGAASNMVKSGREPAFVREARAALCAAVAPDLDASALRALDALIVHLENRKLATGICLIIDEMGKILEYAAMHPSRQDVYLLQQIAERSARTGAQPLVVVGILHQGFSTYASRSSLTLRKEWEKVAGRFEEIVMQPNLEQSMILTGAALRGTQRRPLEGKLKNQLSANARSLSKLGWFGPLGEPSSELLCGLYPIHSSAFPVLVRLFQRFGQNERSLFGFLLLDEPFGLQDFMTENREVGSLYRIHQIFDYVSANFAPQLRHEPGSRWDVLEALVSSYAARGSEDELLILKSIAVLNLLDSQGLLATDALLRLSLSLSANRYERALTNLTKGLRIVYDRGHSGGYCLWSHTSVDLVDCYSRAEREIGHTEAVADQVKQSLSSRPLVARRHYIETGNLRYFLIQHVTAAEVAHSLDAYNPDQADGQIVIVLCDTEEQRVTMSGYLAARAPHEWPDQLLVAITPPLSGLAPLLHEERCWSWVSTHVPELGQDGFAMAEVSRLLDESRDRLRRALHELLGLGFGEVEVDVSWYRRGRPVGAGGSRQLLRLVSDICESVYSSGPSLRNELVNRAELSSAAAAARMRLIERIFAFPNEPMLGLDPDRKPPEMSMYLSALHNSGLHGRVGKKGWGFRLPKDDICNLKPALTCVISTLKDAAEKRVSLGRLMELLRRPPYGIREGLILLLIAVACAIDEQNIALYERGSFVRKVTGEHFARMTKQPDEYAFQYYAITGVRSALFRQLLQLLDSGHQPDAVNLLDVVRPLLEFAGQLPLYATRSKRLGAEARAVRVALLVAREPAALIFDGLPRACGLVPFPAAGRKHSKADVERFLATLRAALDELRAAYFELVERLWAELAATFDYTGNPHSARPRLAERARRLLNTAREPRLKGFCLRLADAGLADEPWMESLASFVCAKPPKNWFDADADRFDEELALLRDRFVKAESLSFSERDGDHAVRVSLTRADGSQVDQVVHLSPDELVQVAELEVRFRELLEKHRRLGLAAMSRAMWEALDLTVDSD